MTPGQRLAQTTEGLRHFVNNTHEYQVTMYLVTPADIEALTRAVAILDRLSTQKETSSGSLNTDTARLFAQEDGPTFTLKRDRKDTP